MYLNSLNYLEKGNQYKSMLLKFVIENVVVKGQILEFRENV